MVDTPSAALPGGVVRKLQMLENIIRCSPSILNEDARDTFLVLIWLALADLDALPAGSRKAA